MINDIATALYSVCLFVINIHVFDLYEGHDNIVPRARLHPDLTSAVRNCSLVKELDDSAQGTGFAFIVMADVFTKIPGAPFWSALFFLMLLSLGLGSQIGIIEGLTSTLFDHPRLHKVRVVIGGDQSLHWCWPQVRKPVLTAAVALFCCLLGLVFTTGAGEYWLTLFDTFGATGTAIVIV